MAFDLLMALVQLETAGEGNIAHIVHVHFMNRGNTQPLIVGPNPLDCAQRPGAKTRAIAVGHCQVHRYAHNGHLKLVCGQRAQILGWGIQKRRHARIGRRAVPAIAEDVGGDFLEMRVIHLAALIA